MSYTPDFHNKDNHHLLYYFGKGLLSNIEAGSVLSQVKQGDATALSRKDWKAIFDYNLYGEPSLSLFGRDPAFRAQVVFVLDGSGSMVSPEPGKWQAAVDAAVLFYDLMKALRYPTFEDQYSSVVFRWLYPGSTDGTTTVPPGTGMQDMTVPLTSGEFIPTYTPDPPYSTPMGLGLRLAADQFDLHTEDALFTDKVILLLSDGKHNRGPDPLDDVIHATDWPGGVRVHTVGLGEDDIEPETIEEIAGATYADFRISPSPREIEGFFCEVLTSLSWKLQDITVVGDTVAIDQGKVVFIVVWDDPALPVSFELDPPGAGANLTPASPGAHCTYTAAAPGSTHAFYSCDGLPELLLGDWRFTAIGSGGSPVPLSDVLLKVIEDPDVIADFAIGEAETATGDPIRLTARITEGGHGKAGVPLVHAELVRSPAVAPGDIMSEKSPPPDYPQQPSPRIDTTPRRHYLQGVMQELGLTSLSSTETSRVDLRDDGLGGDAHADDGIYTGFFSDTELEGSYTFRFRARGTTAEGHTFDRTATLSEYVTLRAAPETTTVDVDSVTAVPDEKIVRAVLYVTPRDRFGSHLGPFREDRISVTTTVGTVGPPQDRLDGSYAFQVTYPIGVTPQVSVAVGDVLVVDRLEVEAPPPRRQLGVSAHLGYTDPRGAFGQHFDGGPMIGIDFEVALSGRWSAIGLLAFNSFQSSQPSVADIDWWNLSVNAKYELGSGSWRPYANGGLGLYLPDSGSAEPGFNLGVGVDRDLTPTLVLEIGLDYHRILDSVTDPEFTVAHAGLIWRF